MQKALGAASASSAEDKKYEIILRKRRIFIFEI
jgi:hypothetical protein